jgi:hypothetical protein
MTLGTFYLRKYGEWTGGVKEKLVNQKVVLQNHAKLIIALYSEIIIRRIGSKAINSVVAI